MTDTRQALAALRAQFEAWAEPILGDNPTWRESGPCELAWQAYRAALSAQPVAGAEPFAYVLLNKQGDITRAMRRPDRWMLKDKNAVPVYTAPQAAPAPEQNAQAGWKLVPVEPTWDMQMAASSAYREPRDGHYTARMECAANAYRAMLAASPQPEPSAQGEPVAWLRQDWSGSGPSSLSFDGPPDPKPVRDEVVNPIWTPLYASAPSTPPPPSAQGEPVACDRDAPVCPWCDRQGWDICQHADDARTCGK